MARDLAQRAQQSVARQQGGSVETFQSQLSKMQDQFQRAMPRGLEAVQLIRDVMTCMRQTPKLAECARTEAGALSILGSAMTCAQLGLRPGVGALGHAWILPFWDNRSRTQKAQLIIGYKGYVELGQRSDRIGSLHSRIVYENDDFRLRYGLDKDDFEHTPYFQAGHDTPGAVRLFYAVGRLANGGTAMDDQMTLAEMQAHRDQFAMAKKDGRVVGPWADHFLAMGRKTMLQRLMALMPKSTDIARAMENDGAVRLDISPGAIDTPDYVDGQVIDDEPEPEPATEPQAETINVSPPADTPSDADTPAADGKSMSEATRRKWQNRMFALLAEADCPDREDQLIVLNKLASDAGRMEPLEHRDGLTDDELRAVVNAMNAAVKGGHLGQLVTDALQAYVAAMADDDGNLADPNAESADAQPEPES